MPMVQPQDDARRGGKVAFGVVLNLDGIFFLMIRWAEASKCGDRDLSATSLPAEMKPSIVNA